MKVFHVTMTMTKIIYDIILIRLNDEHNEHVYNNLILLLALTIAAASYSFRN